MDLKEVKKQWSLRNTVVSESTVDMIIKKYKLSRTCAELICARCGSGEEAIDSFVNRDFCPERDPRLLNDMDKAVIKAKKVECIIGLFFLLPPVLGVFAFVLQLFEADTDFSMLRDLSSNWTNDYSSEGGGGMSAAPIYLGLMALAGVYLIKDSFYALFVTDKQNEK